MRHLAPSRPSSARRGASALWLVLAAIVGVLVLGGLVAVSRYNAMVGSQQTVKKCWSEVQNMYQRRFELVPQLVETVKGAASFEQETLTNVTRARASVSNVQLPAGLPTDPQEVERYLAAQRTLGAALTRLFAVAEDYPELKAVEAFRDLQHQLEGTENRIAVARGDYIDAVKDFNTLVLRFPNVLIARPFGFEPLPQLQPEAPVAEVPEIDFGNGE